MSGQSTWVIFDLDGTLIESEQIWRDVRHDFVVENGGRWTPEAQNAMIGMRTSEWATYIHDDLGVALAPDQIAKPVIEAVAARLKDPPLLPGADAALRRLARAFGLALATSAALPIAQAVLAATGWDELFAVVVSADQVQRGKPAPDVYLRVLEVLGAAPTRTAAVEDSANGIRSAHAAGLGVVAIPNHEFPPSADTLDLASRVLPRLDELTEGVIRSILPSVESPSA